MGLWLGDGVCGKEGDIVRLIVVVSVGLGVGGWVRLFLGGDVGDEEGDIVGILVGVAVGLGVGG